MTETSTIPPAPEAPAAPPPSSPGAPPSSGAPEPRKGGGATAGVVLIVIGAILLAVRLSPGVQWWNLWPIIVIVAGLAQAFTPGEEGWGPSRLFDGFVTVAVGTTLLLMTLGIVAWSAVWRIVSLWPVLLISLGLELLGKALRMTWLRVVGSLIVIGALVFAVAGTGEGMSIPVFRGSSAASTPFSFSERQIGERTAKLKLDAGAAQVSLQGGTPLVAAEGRSPWGKPEFSVDRKGTSADVTVSLGRGQSTVGWPGAGDARLDLELSRSVLWDAELTTGVSELDADLADVRIRSLEVRPGVADCRIRLGQVPTEVGAALVRVKAGVSSVVLKVPKGAAVRLKVESGLSSTRVDPDLARVDNGVWETPGFAGRKASGIGVYEISVRSGVGSFALETY